MLHQRCGTRVHDALAVELVQFSPGQADELVAMWRASFEEAVGMVDPHPVEEQRAYLFETVVPNNRVLVALHEERMVGFVAASPERIDQLYVHRDYQRRGIGSKLLQWAKDHSMGRLSLYTFERNHRAQRFYEGKGFSIVARGFEAHWKLADIRYEWHRAQH